MLNTLVSYLKRVFSSKRRTIWFVSIFSFVTLLLLIQAVNSFTALRKIELHNEHLLQTVPLTPQNIQSWMTFDYLNFFFKLPPSYLREKLAIQDAKYPRITIRKYAKQNKLDLETLLQAVGEAIADYR